MLRDDVIEGALDAAAAVIEPHVETETEADAIALAAVRAFVAHMNEFYVGDMVIEGAMGYLKPMLA